MAARLVAVDASSLIGLSVICAFDIREQLFGRVAVTTAVRDEVARGKNLPGAAELEAGGAGGWVRIRTAPAAEFPKLGHGEASALALAMAHDGAKLVVIDEQLGRAHAKEHGVPVTGVVGILLDAKRQGSINELVPFLQPAYLLTGCSKQIERPSGSRTSSCRMQ